MLVAELGLLVGICGEGAGSGAAPEGMQERKAFKAVEHELEIASACNQPRTHWPRSLDFFPFRQFGKARRPFLLLFHWLFKEQRDVNGALIGATRSLADLVALDRAGNAEESRDVRPRLVEIERRLAEIERRLASRRPT